MQGKGRPGKLNEKTLSTGRLKLTQITLETWNTIYTVFNCLLRDEYIITTQLKSRKNSWRKSFWAIKCTKKFTSLGCQNITRFKSIRQRLDKVSRFISKYFFDMFNVTLKNEMKNINPVPFWKLSEATVNVTDIYLCQRQHQTQH